MSPFAETNDPGFSLIETLIALVLLMVGIAATTTGFSEGQRLAGEVALRQRAVSLARDKLTEKLGMTSDAITSVRQPHERIENGVLVGQDWIEGISRTWVVEPDQPARGLIRVWVSASWVRRGARDSYQVAGLLADGVTP